MGHSFSLSVQPNVHGSVPVALRPDNAYRHTRVGNDIRDVSKVRMLPKHAQFTTWLTAERLKS